MFRKKRNVEEGKKKNWDDETHSYEAEKKRTWSEISMYLYFGRVSQWFVEQHSYYDCIFFFLPFLSNDFFSVFTSTPETYQKEKKKEEKTHFCWDTTPLQIFKIRNLRIACNDYDRATERSSTFFSFLHIIILQCVMYMSSYWLTSELSFAKLWSPYIRWKLR